MAPRPPRRRMGVMPGRSTYQGYTPGAGTNGNGGSSGGGGRPPGYGQGSGPGIPGQGTNPWDYTAMSGCDVLIDSIPGIPQQMRDVGKFYCYQYGIPAAKRWLGIGGGDGGGNGGTAPEDLVDTEECQEGYHKVMGKCVRIQAAPPGGQPFITDEGWVSTTGSFGMSGYTPVVEQRQHLTCPPGHVLGQDNVCYPKAILPRRSQFRKWKGSRRPPVSVRDAQAIRRAERAKGRVKKLAKDVGFSVKKR